MSDHSIATARRVLTAIAEKPLDDGALHYDVRILAQEILTPSALVEAPEDLGGGHYRWVGRPGPDGWFVQVTPLGEVMVCGMIPAADRAGFTDIIRVANALAAQLPHPDHEEAS